MTAFDRPPKEPERIDPAPMPPSPPRPHPHAAGAGAPLSDGETVLAEHSILLTRQHVRHADGTEARLLYTSYLGGAVSLMDELTDLSEAYDDRINEARRRN